MLSIDLEPELETTLNVIAQKEQCSPKQATNLRRDSTG